MKMHQKHTGSLFCFCGLLFQSLVVQALITRPSNVGRNSVKTARSLPYKSLSTSSSSPMLSMTSDINNNPSSSSEEKDDNDDNTNNTNDNNNSDNDSRQHRLAKAQAEIDRILSNPVDPPFDIEKEMKRVASISPPLIKEGSNEYQLEEQVSQIEEELYKAVKDQDFTTAAKRSAEISQLHVDDCGNVLQANSAFYRAFSDKDVGEMERLWLADRSCICIHPSFSPLSGVRDIMKTWKRMFESSVGSFQRTWIDPCEIHLTVKATTAIVTCEEHVYARRFVRGQRRKSERVNKLMATNIFRKVGGKWYMTYHHSSWHADSEAAKRALKGRNIKKKSKPSILGLENFGPVLGDESDKQNDDAGGPKIIASNLDFLKNLGGLDGMLGMGPPGGGNTDGNDLIPGTIISFSGKKNKKNKNRAKSVRSKCIDALRRLSNEGRISPKQKRVLLTDIISCTSRGEESLVEVGYKLLCGEGMDEEADEEEFVDQCQVFARSLFDMEN
ncbi:hypothetical protein FRACYDRAFT_232703 [Fragilariopsis cylindrus CCMP1102]|uniref:SnoaL-like domain-containing protein n=1 Tax=Fragilariopsis cylindrus CCMP1102 TaxID=635003 RepID=A0A1E7FWP1_9STRA|nr:hypothetical protein FRACYDRAFT_232703 [Fragilariopsis cylindrus CCMP1102]|eukprot:OEU22545.1 hypothetical protein FRACYDRAFT_232703 [Fragilariopsis cylindrus CCMP1102]